MRVFRLIGIFAVALPLACANAPTEASAQTISSHRDGSVAIAGRRVRCGNTNGVLDRRLPNLGAAIPGEGLVVLNPTLLSRQPQVVRLFVFHHECGHHYVGASEYGADCWAVNQGVRQGWLDNGGLQQVCRSFGNGPASATHPAGNDRCANVQRCLATAMAGRGQRGRASASAASSGPLE